MGPGRLLAVFARLERAGRSLSRPSFTAQVTVLLENGTRVDGGEVRLVDDGFGEPDMQAEDGVARYSAVLCCTALHSAL